MINTFPRLLRFLHAKLKDIVGTVAALGKFVIGFAELVDKRGHQ